MNFMVGNKTRKKERRKKYYRPVKVIFINV